jgi:hypothetical protein
MPAGRRRSAGCSSIGRNCSVTQHRTRPLDRINGAPQAGATRRQLRRRCSSAHVTRVARRLRSSIHASRSNPPGIQSTPCGRRRRTVNCQRSPGLNIQFASEYQPSSTRGYVRALTSGASTCSMSNSNRTPRSKSHRQAGNDAFDAYIAALVGKCQFVGQPHSRAARRPRRNPSAMHARQNNRPVWIRAMAGARHKPRRAARYRACRTQ